MISVSFGAKFRLHPQGWITQQETNAIQSENRACFLHFWWHIPEDTTILRNYRFENFLSHNVYEDTVYVGLKAFLAFGSWSLFTAQNVLEVLTTLWYPISDCRWFPLCHLTPAGMQRFFTPRNTIDRSICVLIAQCSILHTACPIKRVLMGPTKPYIICNTLTFD